MIAILLCVVAGMLAFVLGRRSLAAGCIVVAATGYAYGILRANLFSPFSYFIFDASLVGLFAAQFLPGSKKQSETPRNSTLNTWLMILMIWPLLMLFLPFQPLLVSIVGLRGNMFMLPTLLLGTRLRSRDLHILAFGFAALNITALGVGVAEYFKGLELFFPHGPTTFIMYLSMDSDAHFRIPSLFINAHTYSSVMMDTVPILFGSWVQQIGTTKRKLLLLLGLGSAFFGVLLAETRTGMMTAGFLTLVAMMSGKVGPRKRLILALAIAGVVFGALHNSRWQRFKEIGADSVTDRIAGSVNRSFLEILFENPMGNGLGGGGTSIPYFLEQRVNRPVGLENEYSRILLEQGVPGLILWIAFVFWFLSKYSSLVKDQWTTGRRMAWWLTAFGLFGASLGVGLFTVIPGSFLFLLGMGWALAKPDPVPARPEIFIRRRAMLPAAAGSKY